jgi:hypothetical protein
VLALRRLLPAQHAALASAMACFLMHASPVDTLDDLCTGLYIGLVSAMACFSARLVCGHTR